MGFNKFTFRSAYAPFTGSSSLPKRRYGGYNPKIHGNYDPNADYVKEAERKDTASAAAVLSAASGVPKSNAQDYTTTAKRESNCKQYMEKALDFRSKTNDRKQGST
jgi:hypothetical protein